MKNNKVIAWVKANKKKAAKIAAGTTGAGLVIWGLYRILSGKAEDTDVTVEELNTMLGEVLKDTEEESVVDAAMNFGRDCIMKCFVEETGEELDGVVLCTEHYWNQMLDYQLK